MWCPIFVSWTSVLAPPQSHRRQQFGYEGSRKSKERSIRRHFHSNPPNSPTLSAWSDLGHKVIRSLLGELPTHPIHQSRTLSLTLKISPQNTMPWWTNNFLSVKDEAEEVSQFEDGRLPTINIVAQLSGRRNLIKPRRGSLSPSNCSYFFF